MNAFLRTLWHVAIWFLTITVVLLAFGVAQNSFQIVVIAALTLIYFSIVAAFRAAQIRTSEVAEGGFSRFVVLLRALDRPEAEEYSNLLEQVKAKRRAQLALTYVGAFVELLIGLYAIYQIARATLL